MVCFLLKASCQSVVAHGAEVQVRNDAGKSALNFAEEREHKDVALYLRELGLTS